MVCLRGAVVMMLVSCASPAMAVAPRELESVVSIRIHDYSRAPSRQLQHAQRLVSDTYARIGVRLEWRMRVRPAELAEGRGVWPKDGMASVTVIILSNVIADRLNLPAGVAGYAPITRARGGRVADVIGDRTRSIASRGRVPHASVLAGVIAHELAHLLMPERSHSPEGVMRAHVGSTGVPIHLPGALLRHRSGLDQADGAQDEWWPLGPGRLKITADHKRTAALAASEGVARLTSRRRLW